MKAARVQLHDAQDGKSKDRSPFERANFQMRIFTLLFIYLFHYGFF